MKIEFTTLKEVSHLLKYHYRKNRPIYIRKVIKATIKKEVVGCIIFVYAPLSIKCRDFKFKDLNKEVCLISRIIVKPKFRRLGIATKMLKFALRSGEFKFIEVIIEKHTKRMTKFLNRLGFITQMYTAKRGLRLYGFIFMNNIGGKKYDNKNK